MTEKTAGFSANFSLKLGAVNCTPPPNCKLTENSQKPYKLSQISLGGAKSAKNAKMTPWGINMSADLRG